MVYADPDTVSVVQAWPKLENTKKVQQFMGLANYYVQYICSFADIAAPLTFLMSPKRQWIWGAGQDVEFDQLRQLLCNPPVLCLPDLSRSFVVDTAACVNATGAVLLQEFSDGLHPVAFHSAKYNLAEHNYGAGDKELFAIIQAYTKWHFYLEGLP